MSDGHPKEKNDPGAEGCPICDAPMRRVVACDAQSMVIQNGAGLLLAPRGHVARWRDLSPGDQAVLAARIGATQDLLASGDAIVPVTLIEGETHVHFRLDPPARARRDPLPGLPHDRALISGGEDALHAHLRPLIDQSTAVDLSVSFLMTSGVRLVLPHLQDLLSRGGRLRVLTGDYLDVTEPAALRLMTDLTGARHLFVFRASRVPFHPKAWLFTFKDGSGALIVGSSNLSKSALTDGVEWNLRQFDRHDTAPLAAARAGFEALLARPEVTDLTPDWIDAYEARRIVPRPDKSGAPEEPTEPPPEPHEV